MKRKALIILSTTLISISMFKGVYADESITTLLPMEEIKEKVDNSDNDSSTNFNGIVYIQDINLKEAIKQELDIDRDYITDEDMKRLTILKIDKKDDCYVESLEGLEYADNLKVLKIPSNSLEDLTPLKDLKNLETLIITYKSNITDLEHIKDLKKLKTLILEGAQKLINIDTISNFKNLVTFSIPNSNIKDLSPLKDLFNLEYLNLNTTKIESLENLSRLINLKSLDISNCNIKDITILKNLSNLEVLICEKNKLQDISIIENLKKLKYVNLSYNRVTDFISLSKVNYSQILACKQYISLSELKLGESTDINIKDKDNTDMELKFLTPGEYKNGKLKWKNRGENKLTFISKNSKNIYGTIEQIVK